MANNQNYSQNAQNQNTQISYTKSAFRITRENPQDPLQGVVGYVEGFIRNITVRDINTTNGPTKVADITMNVVMSDKNIRRLFGDDFNAPNGNVPFKVTYWGSAARSLEQESNEKGRPQRNQKGLALIHNLAVDQFEGRNGKIYKQITATGDGYFYTNSARKEDGEPALDYNTKHPFNGNGNGGNTSRNTGNTSAPAPGQNYPSAQPAQNPAPIVPPIEGVYSSDGWDDDELPF